MNSLPGRYEIDVPGDQVLHGGSDAPVGYELKARPRLVLEINPGDVLRTADAAVPCKPFPGFALSQAINSIRLAAGMEFFETMSGVPLAIQAIGAKSLSKIVWQFVNRAICDVAAPLADTDCVWKGRSTRSID